MTEKYPAMDVDIIVNGLCKSLIIELSSYNLVIKNGGIASYYNPFIPPVITPAGNVLLSVPEHSPEREAVEGLVEGMRNADGVVIATNHDVFNPEIIKAQACLIVDLRNVIKNASNQVFKL